MAKKKNTVNVLDRNIPKMGIKDLKGILRMKMSAGEMSAVLITGGHGIGKSECIWQFAEEIGWRVIDKRLSCMEVGDMVGIGVESVEEDGRKVTSWLMPDWFPLKGKDDKVILFFDEYMRANRDIKNAAMQIILDRHLNGWDLPDNCIVVACVNDGEFYDMVGGLDPAQVDRFSPIVELAPTPDEWLDWAKEKKISPYILQFIRQNKEFLDPPDLSTDDVERVNKYPSRRSWVKLSCLLNAFEKKPDASLQSLIASYVGLTAAINFVKHCDTIIENVPAKDVLAGKDVYTGKEEYWKDITRCTKTIYDLIDEISKHTKDDKGITLAQAKLTDKQYKAIATFVEKVTDMNPEASALFWQNLKKNINPYDIFLNVVQKYPEVISRVERICPDTKKRVEDLRKKIEASKKGK